MLFLLKNDLPKSLLAGLAAALLFRDLGIDAMLLVGSVVAVLTLSIMPWIGLIRD